jgi:hypothetical protein
MLSSTWSRRFTALDIVSKKYERPCRRCVDLIAAGLRRDEAPVFWMAPPAPYQSGRSDRWLKWATIGVVVLLPDVPTAIEWHAKQDAPAAR